MIGLARRDKNRLYNSLKNNFSKIQIPKGAVYSACSVAAGWTDGAILTGLQPWDVASGVILIREAGGEVENLNLKSNKWSNICNKGFYWNSESTIKNEILSTFNDSEIEYV
jgi:fructose-1,6-bisphosphatase/inositol monophosphatase family enzyme